MSPFSANPTPSVRLPEELRKIFPPPPFKVLADKVLPTIDDVETVGAPKKLRLMLPPLATNFRGFVTASPEFGIVDVMFISPPLEVRSTAPDPNVPKPTPLTDVMFIEPNLLILA